MNEIYVIRESLDGVVPKASEYVWATSYTRDIQTLLSEIDKRDEALREARELMQKGLNIHKTRLGYTKQWVLAIIAWLDKYGDEE